MGSINDIYSDFFGSLDELQKENNKRLEELNQMLHGENGILNDGLPGSLPGAGNISGGTVMGGDHSFTTGAEGSVWNSEGGEIAGKILSGSGRPAGAGPVSEEDALQHAQDALSDAKSLFGKPPVAKAAGDPAKATEVPPKKDADTTPTAMPSGILCSVTASSIMVVRASLLFGPSAFSS